MALVLLVEDTFKKRGPWAKSTEIVSSMKFLYRVCCILNIVFEHVSPHVTRKTLLLGRFQEFVIVLMKHRKKRKKEKGPMG